jgi:hypothetical protein
MSNVVPAERVCPRCGAKLDGFGPEGLCGACLIRSGLLGPEHSDVAAALGALGSCVPCEANYRRRVRSLNKPWR